MLNVAKSTQHHSSAHGSRCTEGCQLWDDSQLR